MQLTYPHWNLKSCFVMIRSVWVHLGPFRCFTILGSNHAELLQLVQKFKPQSCNRILCNKSAQSTATDLSVMVCFIVFGGIWEHFVTAVNSVQLMQKFVPQRRVRCFHNERTQSTPLDPQTHLLLRFVVFGSISDRSVAL